MARPLAPSLWGIKSLQSFFIQVCPALSPGIQIQEVGVNPRHLPRRSSDSSKIENSWPSLWVNRVEPTWGRIKGQEKVDSLLQVCISFLGMEAVGKYAYSHESSRIDPK